MSDGSALVMLALQVEPRRFRRKKDDKKGVPRRGR